MTLGRSCRVCCPPGGNMSRHAMCSTCGASLSKRLRRVSVQSVGAQGMRCARFAADDACEPMMTSGFTGRNFPLLSFWHSHYPGWQRRCRRPSMRGRASGRFDPAYILRQRSCTRRPIREAFNPQVPDEFATLALLRYQTPLESPHVAPSILDYTQGYVGPVRPTRCRDPPSMRGLDFH